MPAEIANYVRFFMPRSAPPSIANVQAAKVNLNIQGTIREACAAGLQESLTVVPGVLAAEVSYRGKSAHRIVNFDKSMAATDAALRAIPTSGYQTSTTATAQPR